MMAKLVLALLAIVPLLGAEDCLCEGPSFIYTTSGHPEFGTLETTWQMGSSWKPCQFYFNVVDRWDGSHPLVKPDTRPNEFWYHTPTAAQHFMKFTKVPDGRRVRIVGFDLNVVARFTRQDASRRGLWWARWVFGIGTPWEDRYPSGWAFIALHTGDHTGDQAIVDQTPSSDLLTGVSRDVLLWKQMPISEQQINYVRAWREDSIINGILPRGVLELRQGMFNWSGHEAQVETTARCDFCYTDEVQ